MIEVSSDKEQIEVEEEEPQLDEEEMAFAELLEHEIQGVDQEQKDSDTDMFDSIFDSRQEPDDASDFDYDLSQDRQI